MSTVYLIKDKTDQHFRKPYVKICPTLSSTLQAIAGMRNKMPVRQHELISYESMEVPDFDSNKTALYLVFDRTDKNIKKPVVAIRSNYMNACEILDKARKGVSSHVKKLISIRTEDLSA